MSSEVGRLLAKMTDEEKDKYEDELHELELLEEEVERLRETVAAMERVEDGPSRYPGQEFLKL